MGQGYLFRSFFFIIALACYLYLFDPSFIKFLGNLDNVIKLNIDDRHLINTCIWLFGFWGIFIYLNTSKKLTRNIAWAVFIGATFVNVMYIQIVGNTISVNNAQKLGFVLSEFAQIEMSSLLEFIVVSALFFGLSFFIIKPLDIGISRWLPTSLVTMVIAIMVIFSGKNIVLQSTYLVPGVLIYKYILVGISYLKKHVGVKSGAAAKKALS